MSSPEERELESKRQELERLIEQVAAEELTLNDVTSALAGFHRRYLSQVGAKYARLDELRAQVAELRAQRAPDETPLGTAANTARERATRSAVECAAPAAGESQPPLRGQPSEDVKRLYRRIAGAIHPDRSTDRASRDRRTRLMAELNDAYGDRDVARMRAVLEKWEESPEGVSGEGIGADLVRTVRAIAQTKRRIAEIRRIVSEILASDLHRLMFKVHEAAVVGRDILSEMGASLDAQIDSTIAELEGLR